MENFCFETSSLLIMSKIHSNFLKRSFLRIAKNIYILFHIVSPNWRFSWQKNKNKVIEDIWRNHRYVTGLSKLAAGRDLFQKNKQNRVVRYGPEKCVYKISGLCRFPLGQWAWHKYTHWHTYKRKKIGISPTRCSPHVPLWKFILL